VHPVQYLLVGLAISVFFLLLLSLSEHLGFGLSYGAAAAAAVVGLLSFYGTAMLHHRGQGLGFGALIALLYGALYVVLIQEQTALLIGALLLFSVLALVMVLTRRIDWYGLQDQLGTPADAAFGVQGRR
jgi:inner membrane protein